jgi:hypothetical protein
MVRPRDLVFSGEFCARVASCAAASFAASNAIAKAVISG